MNFVVAGRGARTIDKKNTQSTASPQGLKWTHETDVVVLGFGFAGQVAAISAHDERAEVLVLEKMDEGRSGGNSRVSGQYVFTPSNARDAAAYLTAMNGGFIVPPDMIEQWAEYMVDNYAWYERMGGTEAMLKMPLAPRPPEFPQLPGASCVQGWGARTPGGLWEFLKPRVIERGMQVLYETPGKELVQDPVTKRILGVVAERNGIKTYVKARRAVVLCTGGFENDPQMLADYHHLYDTCTRGTPYNTGDGIRMAQAVGADLWHMANSLPYIGFKPPEYDFGIKLAMTMGHSFIYIGADNKRFVNEQWPGTHHGKHERHGYWLSMLFPLPIHAIFDETMRRSGPLNVDREDGSPWGWGYQIGGYVWSDDNRVELEKGWIIKADTIRELATRIGRDPDAVEATVKKYNEYCAAGVDPDFGRGADPGLGKVKTLADSKSGSPAVGKVKARLEPIHSPPYYAIEAKPQILNTQGGPRRNKYAQVLDSMGKAIPGLYSAGELGSIYSDCYQGGGNVGECIAFGRIAGMGAAKERPWN